MRYLPAPRLIEFLCFLDGEIISESPVSSTFCCNSFDLRFRRADGIKNKIW